LEGGRSVGAVLATEFWVAPASVPVDGP